MKLLFTALLLIIPFQLMKAQDVNLLANIDDRHKTSLNGKWNIIIDPYENGYYNYRYEPAENGYFENRKPKDKSDLVEYDFDKSEQLNVPGDWNTQMEKLLLYEGTIWYKKSFEYEKKAGKRVYIYFGAVNYQAIVYVNGKKAGEHEGGFTPFNFDVTDLIHSGSNFVIVKADNKRKREAVPTVNTDWWNYGGITRDVYLAEVPDTHIQDYSIQLKKGSMNEITGWVKLSGINKKQNITINIPEAKITKTVTTGENGIGEFSVTGKFKLWAPDNPYLYKVTIISSDDTLNDQIGFRSIETKGTEILLNGKPIFLKGISIHEESPVRQGRACTEEDAVTLLTWAKELGCNYVRLAHYPHNEYMIREAEKMGIMVWSEIPVYWTILWENKDTYNNASRQLTDMITRDKNRANVIIWSVANETPRGESRLNFLKGLISQARKLDPTRLITAATEISYNENRMVLNDVLGEYLDVIGVNEYIGWYGGNPEDAITKIWESKYDKPLIISEFGADAKFNYHGDTRTKFTEEYQANLYSQQITMLKKISFLRGVSPWILKDFRSPRRPLAGIQDFYNRKGLISEKGEKKQAFRVLQEYYQSVK